MGIILLVLIGVGIYFVFSKNKKFFRSNEMETSLDILKKRYSRGKISKQEFDRLKKDLEL